MVATVFVMLFLWLSSVPLLSWYEYSAHHRELEDASFAWHQQRLGDYSFEFDAAGSTEYPFRLPLRIHVRDGSLLNAYELDSNKAVDISGLTDVPHTIDMAYDIVAGLLEQRPHSIDIRYDALLHYPREISVRPSASGEDSVTYYLGALQEADGRR